MSGADVAEANFSSPGLAFADYVACIDESNDHTLTSIDPEFLKSELSVLRPAQSNRAYDLIRSKILDCKVFP